MLQGEREMAARQPHARPLPPRRHPAGAARRAADRGHLRHRRQRHPQRRRPRTRHRQGAEDPHHRLVGARQGRGRADGPRRRSARRRGQDAPRGGRDRATRPRPLDLPGRADDQGPRRQGAVRGQARGREPGRVAARGAQGLRRRGDPDRHDRPRRDPQPGVDRRLRGVRGRGRVDQRVVRRVRRFRRRGRPR